MLAACLELRGDDEGPLFAPVDKAGRVQVDRGLTGRAVARRVELCSEQARIGRLSPHMRRTSATQVLAQGVEMAAVADLMGNSSHDTIRRYDRREEQNRGGSHGRHRLSLAQTGNGE
ncbi:MAG: hypothetical protein OXH32_03495 [Acidobacteria bacterium]|nr:hypothetical protein [Acidobacteriota bacterium]